MPSVKQTLCSKHVWSAQNMPQQFNLSTLYIFCKGCCVSLPVELCVADGGLARVQNLCVVGAVDVEDFAYAAAVKSVEVL